MSLRAIIWAAVSTAPQANEDEKVSLPKQESDARALCDRNGWSMVEVLKVPGHSRHYIDIHQAASDMREQGIVAFDRLLDHWRLKDFDVLIVRDGDRFARTQTLHSYVTESTIQMGARIYSLTDGWIDETNYRLWIAMGGYRAASDIDRLVKARKAGMDKRAQRGLPTSSGLLWSHLLIRDSNGNAQKVIVDPAKRRLLDDLADVVIEGVSWPKVGKELYTRFGHVNNSGKAFGTTQMYQALHNPTFWGNNARYFNSKKYPNRERKGLWCFDPDIPAPEGVVIFYGTHEPAYTGEVAAKVQAELRRRRGIQGNTRPNRTHRFTGLLICAECGYNLTITYSSEAHDRMYWRCNSKYNERQSAAACSQNKFIRDDAVFAVIDDLLHQMIDLRDLRPFESDTPPNADSQHITLLENEIATLEGQLQRLIMKQASIEDESLWNAYDAQILATNDRLKIMRADLHARRLRQPSSAVRQEQERAYRDIADMTVEQFWRRSSTEINQYLHRLMGGRRFLVYNGQIVRIRDG
ncbi:MAG TPA: recombinase family protein [Aggregatilineaceae bacterium]|nr:recombinase family protein [Aggregatilineaceae bacterium]